MTICWWSTDPSCHRPDRTATDLGIWDLRTSYGGRVGRATEDVDPFVGTGGPPPWRDGATTPEEVVRETLALA